MSRISNEKRETLARVGILLAAYPRLERPAAQIAMAQEDYFWAMAEIEAQDDADVFRRAASVVEDLTLASYWVEQWEAVVLTRGLVDNAEAAERAAREWRAAEKQKKGSLMNQYEYQQAIELFETFNTAVSKVGGGPIPINMLSRMTALDFFALICTNGIRFVYSDNRQEKRGKRKINMDVTDIIRTAGIKRGPILSQVDRNPWRTPWVSRVVKSVDRPYHWQMSLKMRQGRSMRVYWSTSRDYAPTLIQVMGGLIKISQDVEAYDYLEAWAHNQGLDVAEPATGERFKLALKIAHRLKSFLGEEVYNTAIESEG